MFSTHIRYKPFVQECMEAMEIDAFLSKIYTSKEKLAYIKRVLASILDGTIKHEKSYFLTGSGANGKSKLISLLQQAIGDYACVVPISLLTQKRAESTSANCELVRTKGRRFGITQEPGEEETLNVGIFKELTGGDKVIARGLWKEPIEFKPQFKLCLVCNDLPKIQSDDGGTWRRIIVIEHTSKFVDEPSKPNEFLLDEKLEENFARWAGPFVAMLIHIHATTDLKNIHMPAEVARDTKRYRMESNDMMMYLEEGIKEDKTETHVGVTIQAVYRDFRTWLNKVFSGRRKIPDMSALKFKMEELYGSYPPRGWKNLIFKHIGTLDDVNNSDDDDDEVELKPVEVKGELTEAMKSRFTFVEGYDTTNKELKNYHQQCCGGVDHFKLIDFIFSKGAIEDKNLMRDGKRGKRGFRAVGISELF